MFIFSWQDITFLAAGQSLTQLLFLSFSLLSLLAKIKMFGIACNGKVMIVTLIFHPSLVFTFSNSPIFLYNLMSFFFFPFLWEFLFFIVRRTFKCPFCVVNKVELLLRQICLSNQSSFIDLESAPMRKRELNSKTKGSSFYCKTDWAKSILIYSYAH